MAGGRAPLKNGGAPPPLLGSIARVVGAWKWGGLVKQSKMALLFMTLWELPIGFRIPYVREFPK